MWLCPLVKWAKEKYHFKGREQTICILRIRGAGCASSLMPLIPALQESKAGRSLEARSSRTTWSTWWNPVSTKNAKISQVCWHVPVVPAHQETGVGESLGPRMQRLQWAKITLLYSGLGDKARLCLKKNKLKLTNIMKTFKTSGLKKKKKKQI